VQQVAEQVEMSGSYLSFMAMAGILAAVALLTNSVPILIGAMIVAPAFAPLALVAFASVGRQPRQALRGAGVALVGLLIAMICTIVTTWIMNVTDVLPADANLIDKPLIEERVHPGWYSVVAAIAAGVAGTIASVKQKQDTLIGTVAALALVPAAGAAGIAFLSQDPTRGLGGLGLLAINVGLIIVMGIVVLMVMRPARKDDYGPS
jgi:uncharacterized hydrophobic protein (TIGR00271 family)